MKKLIIENRTHLPMIDCLGYCEAVMMDGRISETGKGNQFCFHTEFHDGVHVSAFLNEKSDRLVVHNNMGSKDE
jgi:hypothetical protein